MRPDMAKVITERPRAKGHSVIKGRRKCRPFESLPFRESTARKRRPYGTEKQLTDLLGPLEGFLASNCGRPWDKVYSEIRRNISVRRQVDLHILDHVEWFVEKDVMIVDGVPYKKARARWDNGAISSKFFVHPKTGILTKNLHEYVTYKVRRAKRRTKFLQADELTHIRLLNGLLFKIELARIPEATIDEYKEGLGMTLPYVFHDVVFYDNLVIKDCLEKHGAYVYAVRKRQLGKKDLKVWRPKAEEARLADTFEKNENT